MRTSRTQVALTLRAQCPGRGHCCAHSKLVVRMSRAQPAQVARSACVGGAHAGRALVTTRPGSLPQPLRLCRDLIMMSRHGSFLQPEAYVATLKSRREGLKAKPGRDLKTGSRHRFSCPAPSQVATPKIQVATSWRLPYVATSISCHDLISAHSGISRSRHQKSKSRRPPLPLMSRPQKRCRDLNSSKPHFYYVTTPFFPCRDLPCCHPCRDPKNDVATWGQEKQVSRAAPKSWAHAGTVVRPTARTTARTTAPALRTCCLLVTTSTLGRDPVLEIGSSHSSFCLAQKKNFFFFFQSSSSFPATPRMQ